MIIITQMPCHLTHTVKRGLQKLLIDLAHHHQVYRCLALGLVTCPTPKPPDEMWRAKDFAPLDIRSVTEGHDGLVPKRRDEFGIDFLNPPASFSKRR